MYSTCFANCKNIYPHKLIRPLGKYKFDQNSIIRSVVEDITGNDIRITQYIADNLKRAIAKCCHNHASWFPCEYCFARGVKLDLAENEKKRQEIVEQKKIIFEKLKDCESEIDSPEKKNKISKLNSLLKDLENRLKKIRKTTNILWPFSTMKAQNRTRQSVLDIVEKIENGETLTKEEAKGVVGKSVLFDIPDFNYVYDVPAEYLHSGCLGVVKRLVNVTFNVGEKRGRITTRKLSSTTTFNILMCETKVFREFSRRARELDFAMFKAQEYRNLGLFFFPLILECIEPEAKERELWLNLSYIMRSSILPSEEYWQIDLDCVMAASAQFYETFEKLMGPQNCTYSFHVFLSHILEIRTHGPLTQTSAFKFESFYGELRRSFVTGSVSPLKQIMKNIYLKRALSSHCCKNSIYLSNYETALENNRLVYCYIKNEYLIYQIETIESEILTCRKVGKYPAKFNETPNINWSSVGVFRKGGICSKTTKIPISETRGKVIKVGNYLMTCPENVYYKKNK